MFDRRLWICSNVRYRSSRAYSLVRAIYFDESFCVRSRKESDAGVLPQRFLQFCDLPIELFHDFSDSVATITIAENASKPV